MTWYVVYRGRLSGVYDDREDCRRQVHRFGGNNYKGYDTREEAEARYARYLAGQRRVIWRNRMKTTFFWMILVVPVSALLYALVV